MPNWIWVEAKGAWGMEYEGRRGRRGRTNGMLQSPFVKALDYFADNNNYPLTSR